MFWPIYVLPNLSLICWNTVYCCSKKRTGFSSTDEALFGILYFRLFPVFMHVGTCHKQLGLGAARFWEGWWPGDLAAHHTEADENINGFAR